MIDKLKQYVDLLFAGTDNCDDIKEEILQNTIDRYQDLIDQGKTPEAAYRLAISGIGDINEILGRSAPVSESSVKPTVAASKNTKPIWKKVLQSIAVFLYILCPIPLFVIQNELGLCGLLVIVAVATALIIIGSGKSAKETRDESNETSNSIGNLVWVIILVVYLLLSFTTGGWYITWILFPIAGSINGLIRALSDKKENVLLRVILHAAAILLMLAVLTVGLGIGTYITHFEFTDFNQGTIVSESAEFDPDTIHKIHVDWASGNIVFKTSDRETIKIYEEGTASTDQHMTYTHSGSTLSIQYIEAKLYHSSLHIPSKKLYVEIPATWSGDEIQISVASADILFENITVNEVDLDTASGSVNFTDCKIRSVQLDSASGDIEYTGTLESIHCNAASADLKLTLDNTPSEISMDCASGDIRLTLPEDTGFTVEMDSLSGKFHSEFPATVSGERYIYGDGRCRIEIDSMSGSIHIYKAK